MRYSDLQAESKGSQNAKVTGEKKRSSASSSREDLSEGERERRGREGNQKAGLGPLDGTGAVQGRGNGTGDGILR